MIFLIACEDRGHPLFADTTLPHHDNPAWLYARASYRAIFHGLCKFNKSVWLRAIVNLRFLRKYSSLLFYENQTARFQKIVRIGAPRILDFSRTS